MTLYENMSALTSILLQTNIERTSLEVGVGSNIGLFKHYDIA